MNNTTPTPEQQRIADYFSAPARAARLLMQRENFFGFNSITYNRIAGRAVPIMVSEGRALRGPVEDDCLDDFADIERALNDLKDWALVTFLVEGEELRMTARRPFEEAQNVGDAEFFQNGGYDADGFDEFGYTRDGFDEEGNRRPDEDEFDPFKLDREMNA